MISFKPAICIAAVTTCTVLAAAFSPTSQEDMEMPQPTEHHKHLLTGVGEWEGTLTSYWVPGEKPEPVPARETVSAIGGFWLLSDFKCDFMGMPYHGSGHVGYDANKKKFVGTWVDSMSSTLAVMEGDIDPNTKALVMHWNAPDMTGNVVPHRSESVENGDTRTMTFYAGEGAGVKSMVIEMKRKGKKTTEAGSKK